MPANSIDFASGVPLYRQLAEDLRRRLTEGDFPPGAPMPSEAALEHEYGLGRNTVRRVLYQLRDEGYVKPRRGERWQVADPLPSERGREVVQLPPGARVWIERATDEDRAEHGLPAGASMAVVHHKAKTLRFPADRTEFQAPWRDPSITHDHGSGN
jgi:DNA-binding transcriptional regulator YhcF (GntR family)